VEIEEKEEEIEEKEGEKEEEEEKEGVEMEETPWRFSHTVKPLGWRQQATNHISVIGCTSETYGVFDF
jgi:hypothetical protein